jgi:hypothetical protein
MEDEDGDERGVRVVKNKNGNKEEIAGREVKNSREGVSMVERGERW